jgi:hypothetical protein
MSQKRQFDAVCRVERYSISHCVREQVTAANIDIHSLVASYDHEARKKVLSAFYVAHAILVKYNVEGTPKHPTPSLLSEALSGHASVSRFSVDNASTRFSLTNFKRSLIHIVLSLNLSSSPLPTKSFNHLHQLLKTRLSMSTAWTLFHGLLVRSRAHRLLTLPPSRVIPARRPDLIHTVPGRGSCFTCRVVCAPF